MAETTIPSGWDPHRVLVRNAPSGRRTYDPVIAFSLVPAEPCELCGRAAEDTSRNGYFETPWPTCVECDRATCPSCAARVASDPEADFRGAVVCRECES